MSAPTAAHGLPMTLLDLTPTLDLTLEAMFELEPSSRIQWTNARRIESRWKTLNSEHFLGRIYRSIKTSEAISFRIEGRPGSHWAQSIVMPREAIVEVSESGKTTWAVSSGQPGKIIWLTADCVPGDRFPVDTSTLHSPDEAAHIAWTWMTTAALPEEYRLEPALDGEHRVKQ